MAYLRLLVSNLCNFACKYCHVFKITKNTYPTRIMDFDTMAFSIENFIKILKKNNESSLTISNYGGETLTNKKNLFKAIEKYKNKYEGINIEWWISTNGSLFTEEVADFLKKYDAEIHISADGFAETHNRNRIDKFGKGTFDRVEKALYLIKTKKLRAHINSFIFPENSDNLFEIVDLAKKFDIPRIYLDLLYDTQGRGILPIILSKKYSEIYNYGLENNVKIVGPWTRFFNNKKFSYPKTPPVVVTVEGKFFFNRYPTMTPLDPKYLSNSDDFTFYYKEKASQFKKLVDANCKYCFLKKACNGLMINQFRYHTRLDSGWEKTCETVRRIIKLIKNPPLSY